MSGLPIQLLTVLRPSPCRLTGSLCATAAARRLGVPGIALANVSWDWIHADCVRDVPAYASRVDSLRQSYGRATMLLRLPFHGDLPAFPRIRDVPLVARTARLDRADAVPALETDGAAAIAGILREY